MIVYIVESKGSFSVMATLDQLMTWLHSLRSNGDKYVVYRIDLTNLTVSKM